jgi:hypothetical protein
MIRALILLLIIPSFGWTQSLECQKAIAIKTMFPTSAAFERLFVPNVFTVMGQAAKSLSENLSQANFKETHAKDASEYINGLAKRLATSLRDVLQSETCQAYLERQEKEEALKLTAYAQEFFHEFELIHSAIDVLVRDACI